MTRLSLPHPLRLLALLATMLLALLLTVAPTTAATCTYTVQRGDNLATIAARHGESVATLRRANPAIQNPDLIHVGQRLTLPDCGPTLKLAPAAPADLDPARWEQVRAATLMVRHPVGAPVYGGSAVAVGTDGRTFLTAFHVLHDPATLERSDVVEIGPFDGWHYTAELVDYNMRLDLAVLRVREPDFPGFAHAVPLGRSTELTTESALYTLSYPNTDGTLVTTKGHFLEHYSPRAFFTTFLMTDAAASYGSSGGVAVNERGELIGIISAGIMGREAVAELGYGELEQVTLIVPIDDAAPLLQRVGLLEPTTARLAR